MPATKGRAKRKSPAPKPATKKAPATRGTRNRATPKANCSACDAPPGKSHTPGCPNAQCAECGLTLGHELTCSSHPNYREPVLDGKTGGPIRTEVDGQPAHVHVTSPPEPEEGEKKSGLKLLPPPALGDATLYAKLQEGLDQKIIFGIKQPVTKTKTCEYEWFDRESDQSVGCAAAAAFDFEPTTTCPTCMHTTKDKRDSLCVVHMALRIVGELEERQTSLFDENGGDE